MLINKRTQNENNQSLKRMEKDSLPRRRKAFLPHERLGKRPTYADYAKRGWEGEREEESRKRGRGGGEMKNISGQGDPKEKRSSNSTVISWRNSPGFHFRVYWKLHARDISSTNELESYLAPKYMRLEILFGTITAAPNYCLYVSVCT